MHKIIWGILLTAVGIFSLNSTVLGFQETENHNFTYIDSILDKSSLLKNQGDIVEAKRLIFVADSLSAATNYKTGSARSVQFLGNIYEAEQKFDSALSQYNYGIENYAETPFLPSYYNGIGNVYDNQGRSREALVAFQKALDLVWMTEDEGQDNLSAGIKMNMGNAYGDLGNTALAAENYLQAIKFADQANYVPLMFLSRLNIGVLYGGMDDYEKALTYYEDALNVALQNNLKQYLYVLYNNIGTAKTKVGQFIEAEEYLFRAQDIFEQINPKSPEIIANHNLGELKRKTGDFNEAEDYLMLSLENASKVNLIEAKYHNYLELGRLYLGVNNFEQALQYFNNTIQVAKELDNQDFEKEAQLELYKTYERGRNYKEALDSYERYTAITDSLKQVTQERDLANLESQIELRRQNEINDLLEDKQQQQEARIRTQTFLIVSGGVILILIIALLIVLYQNSKEREQFLREIQAQKQVLEELNKSKDHVFAVVSHDLRSPLTSVLGIIDLIREDVLNGNDLKRLIDDVDQSVRQNVNVIEDLLTWAKDQLSGIELNLSTIHLNSVLTDIITTHSFLAVRKNVELKNKLDGGKYVITADQNLLRVVLRNLISNAVKYTEEKGFVEIDAQQKKEKVVITVKDNGMGIPESAKKKIFHSRTWTRVGTKNEKGSGFGLSITKEFVEKMNGRVWFESEEGKGTTFFVELPDAS
jgi:signal transduction histidine kinase